MSQTIKESVLRLYLSHPYPMRSAEERKRELPMQICKFESLGLAKHMPGARMLDVGCGTGDHCLLAAKYYGVEEWVGLDHSRASLDVATKNARDEGFDRFTPVEGDALNLPFKDGEFDIVVSWGVLHHTSDPLRGFREMVRACKPGGYVGIYLYNRYAHWRHNLRKDRVSRDAGESFEDRFNLAMKRYGTKPLDQMSGSEIASFYDEYCHPHKTDHTIGETLEWFDRVGVDYLGSFPPLSVTDAVRSLQFRGTELSEFEVERPHAKIAVKLASSLPSLGAPRSRRPGLFQRALWQAVYAWQGRGGGYSAGAALAGRKRLA